MQRGHYVFLSFLFFCAALVGYFVGVEMSPAQAQIISCGSVGTLIIAPPPNLSVAYQGVSYSKALTASGGTTCTSPATYTWSVYSGSLPTGITLNVATGALLGTPTGAGPSNFTLQVQDCGQGNAQQTSQIVISINVNILNAVAGIAVTPTTLSVAEGATSTTQLTSTLTFQNSATLPGAGLVAWSVSPLSANICSVDQSGYVTGGTQSGACAVFASFSNQNSNSANVTVTGGSAPSVASIVTSVLPQGFLDNSYIAQTLVESGGTGSCCTWAVTGSLPTGMSFNTGTGVLSGTPSQSGTFPLSFTVTVGMTTSPTVTLPLIINSVNSSVSLALAAGGTAVALSNGGTAQLGLPGCSWSPSGNTTTPCPAPTYNVSSGLINVSTTGLITAAASGTGSATVTVSVAGSSQPSNAVTVTVTATIAIGTAAALPDALINITYAGTQLASSGGTGTGYTYASVSGAPTGLSVSSTGLINGTATTASGSPFTWVIRVTDSGSNTVTKSFAIVVATLQTITLSCTPSPACLTITQSSQVQFTATGNFSDGQHAIVTVSGGGVGTPSWTFCSNTEASPTTVPCTPPAGALVVAQPRSSAASDTFTVKDSLGNSFTQCTGAGGTACPNNSGSQSTSVFYEANAPTGITGVICTATSGNASDTCVVGWITNMALTSPQDGNAIGTGTTSAAGLAIGPITTTNATDVIWAGGEFSSQTSSSTLLPFAIPTNASQTRLAVAIEAVSAIQTALNATINISPGPSPMYGVIAAFKTAIATTGWTESDVTGTNVASVTSLGLVTGHNPAAATISATTGGITGTISITVVSSAATNIVITPSTASIPVGTTQQFAATEGTNNVSSSAMWSLSPATGCGMISTAGLYTAPASACGPVAINAALGAVGCNMTCGSVTVTAVTTNSLLAGCRVTATNTVTKCANAFPPTGWGQSIAENFFGGKLFNAAVENTAQVTIDQCPTLPGGCGNASGWASDNTISAVSNCSPSGGCSPGGWGLVVNLSALGCCTNGNFYLSFVEQLDTNVTGVDTEDVIGAFGGGAIAGFPNPYGAQQQIIMDSQNFNGGLSLTPSMAMYGQVNGAQYQCEQGTDDLSPLAQTCSFNDGEWTIPVGVQTQIELYFHAGTCTDGDPNNDAFFYMYLNGAHVYTVNAQNAYGYTGASGNLNGCVNMADNSIGAAGGYWTFYIPNPTTFHEYVSDVIFLHQ